MSRETTDHRLQSQRQPGWRKGLQEVSPLLQPRENTIPMWSRAHQAVSRCAAPPGPI